MIFSWRRVTAQVHLWLGFALCLPFVVMGLTGSAMALQDQLRAWSGPAASAPGGKPHDIAAILAAARAAAPTGFAPIGYTAPEMPGSGLATVRLAPAGPGGGHLGMVMLAIDPATLAVYPPSRIDGIMATLLRLHSTLFAGPTGRAIVGVIGIAALALIVSGLVNWWPRRGRWRQAFAVTRGARGARLHRELHGALGIWSLAVFVTVVLGGIDLAFPQAIRSAATALSLAQGTPRPHAVPVPGQAPMPVDAAAALALAQAPGSHLGMIFLPSERDRSYRVMLLRPGQSRLAPAVTVTIDPWTRRILNVEDPRRLAAGDRVLAWQHALHSGQGLGPVWQGLVFLTGFLPLAFTVTGLRLWWLKNRARHPAKRRAA